ncbi:MAG: YbjQ family protein [Myxococcota bacterium]
MDNAVIEVGVQIGLPLLLLVSTYFIGGAVERRHYRSIRSREHRLQSLPAITFREVPPGWQVREGALVSGSVVISVDYFKRFLAVLRMLVGGRVKTYETILDRARREAILRLKRDASDRGYAAVINVRLETSRMANATRNGQGVAGLEVLAYGTGLALERGP